MAVSMSAGYCDMCFPILGGNYYKKGVGIRAENFETDPYLDWK